ncbi:TPA: pyrroline-5-carboxylate reductase family protein, partial [Streptococcus pneumoniae]
IDAATGLAGCGPAFVYLFIEALADAGVQTGLPREIALKMAAQTVVGAGQLVLESQQHPGVLKDQVCSPGGSTIAGVASLEAHAFRGTVMDAVHQAYKRTQELGK